MRTKVKQYSLIVFLFLFLFVVIGGGLHLNPGGALLAALTGTPLMVYVFNRRSASGIVEPDSRSSREGNGVARCLGKEHASEVGALEVESVAPE